MSLGVAVRIAGHAATVAAVRGLSARRAAPGTLKGLQNRLLAAYLAELPPLR
jgi:hypothetical protein